MTAAAIRVRLNGKEFLLPEPVLGAALKEARFAAKKGIAVAVNGQVVARAKWETTPLAPGDEVLVIQATQGGR